MLKLHFLSGLPRSGSTLLASLLCQRMGVAASIQSPMGHLYNACHESLGVANEGVDLIQEAQRKRVLRGLFESFYTFPNGATECVFDNSRAWSSRVYELFELLPASKMVVMVRPVNEILNSFERVYRINPLAASRIYPAGTNCTQRCNQMMEPGGVVMTSYNNTKDAFFSPYADRLLFVRYATLCADPIKTVGEIFQFCLGEWWSEINPQTIAPVMDADLFDGRLGVAGLHDLRPSVTHREPEILIPPEIWQAHMNSAFWDAPELNASGVKVI